MMYTIASYTKKEVGCIFSSDINITATPCYSSDRMISILQSICNDDEIKLQQFNKRLAELLLLNIQPANSEDVVNLKNMMGNINLITNDLISWDCNNTTRGYILEREYKKKYNFIQLQNDSIFKPYLLNQLNNMKNESTIKNPGDLELLNETNLNADFINVLYNLGQKTFLNLGKDVINSVIDDLKRKRPFVEDKSLIQYIQEIVKQHIQLLEKMKNEKNIDVLKQLIQSLKIVELDQFKKEEIGLLMNQLIKDSKLFASYPILINFILNQLNQPIKNNLSSTRNTLNIEESSNVLFSNH